MNLIWLVWVVIPLVLIGIIGVQESFAQYTMNEPNLDIIEYFYDDKENWNVVTNSKDGFTLTLQTSQVDYSEHEYIRIKSKVLYTGSESLVIPVDAMCDKHLYNILQAEGNSQTYRPKHDFQFKESPVEELVVCLSAEGVISLEPGESVERDIYWKHGLKPGNYVLTSYWFNYVNASLPIRIIENSLNQESFAEEYELSIYKLSDKHFDYVYKIPYDISDNGIITKISNNIMNQEIIIFIESTDSGVLNIEIPKEMINSTTDCIESGSPFVIYEKKEMIVIPEQTQTSNNYSLPFTEGNHEFEISAGIDNYFGWKYNYRCPNSPLADSIIFSPHKQIANGVDGVICKNDLQFAIKKSDNSQVCISPDSELKLIQRGWMRQ